MYLIRLTYYGEEDTDGVVDEIIAERYEFLSAYHLHVYEPGQPDRVVPLVNVATYTITEVEL